MTKFTRKRCVKSCKHHGRHQGWSWWCSILDPWHEIATLDIGSTSIAIVTDGSLRLWVISHKGIHLLQQLGVRMNACAAIFMDLKIMYGLRIRYILLFRTRSPGVEPFSLYVGDLKEQLQRWHLKPCSQPPVRAPTGSLREKFTSFRSFSYG